MSSLQLIDVCLNLTSDKARARLNALESLLSLLNQDKVLNELNQASLSKDEEINWELLFIRAHKAIFTDIDRLDKENKKLTPKPKEIYENIIPLLAEKSVHCGIPLIDCNTVISNVLSVFEVENRKVLFGSFYLDMLKSYVLNKRECWGKIRSKSWIDLKNFCMEQYKMSTPGLPNTIFLEILAEIIRISSKNSVIINNFLDVFTFIKNIMINKTELKNMQMALLRLTNILCRQMVLEYRYAVCEFVEGVTDYVLNFYEPKTHSKNVHIYHFLATALNVHCPKGSNRDSNLSYAHDWEKWKRQIREIFILCHQEIKEILRDPNKTDVETIFLNLLVDVTYLMFSFGFDQVESSYGVNDVDTVYSHSASSNKRKRSYDLSSQCTPVSVKMTTAKAKQIKLDCSLGNILQELLTPNAWFWLIFLECFFKEYPVILKNEFQQVVDFLSQIYVNQADEKVVRRTCRCLCVLLKIEKSEDINLGDLDKKLLSESWNRISEATLRSFRSHAYQEHYLLINSLIESSKIKEIAPLLDLYREDELLESNINNFNVLMKICQNCVLPDAAESEDIESNVRCQIVRWSTRDSYKYPSKDLSKMLMLMLLKRSEEGSESIVFKIDEEPTAEETGNDFYKTATRNYLLMSFEGLKFNSELKGKENTYDVKIDGFMKNYLFDWIKIRFETLLNQLSDDTYEEVDEHKIVGDSLHFCEVVAYLLSLFRNLNLEIEEEDELMSKLERTVVVCSKKGNELMKSGNINLGPFAEFYKCNFHRELNSKFRERRCVNADFLNRLFCAFRQNYSSVAIDRGENEDFNHVSTLKSDFHYLMDRNHSLLSEEKFTKKEKLTVCVSEVLCRFAVVPGSVQSNSLQNDLTSKMLQVLISDESEHFHSNFRLHLILRMLYNLSKFDGIGSEVLSGVVSILETVFQDKHYDFEIAGIILEISKGLIPLLHRTGNEKTRKKFLRILDDFGAIIEKKSCGLRIAVKYVECLGEMGKLHRKGNETLDENHKRIIESIVSFLRHPCYEVRLTAARNVGFLFSGNQSTHLLRWQASVIEKLRETLSDESGTSRKESCKYSKTVMFSTCLAAWANVICSSAYWRKPSLLNLILFVSEKNVSRSQTENIFKVICRELDVPRPKDLVSKNFPYLFRKWIGEKRELENFPYYLLGCETCEDLGSEQLNVIVPYYLINGQKNKAMALSEKINVPLESCIEKCLPELLAYVLPRLNENITTENVQKAQDLKIFIEELLRPKTLNELLKDHLDKMIFVIMKNFHDSNHFKESCGSNLNYEEIRNEFSYSKEEIVQIFQDLSPIREKSLLGYVALKRPSAVQKILSSLSKEIWTGIVEEDRVVSSHDYFTFLELLSHETKNDASALRRFNCFLIRDSVYNLIFLVRKNYSERLTAVTCRFLKKFSGFYLEKLNEIYIEFLPAIISAIVPLVKKGHGDARDLLNFLMRDNFDKLQSMILLLDPLPAEDIFSESNCYRATNDDDSRTLKEEITRFLDAGKSRNSGCRLEGLKNLRSMLADRKEELKELYENLDDMRGFSEDCHRSSIHRLVCALVELTSDGNVDVKTEAGKCLGELGPGDLTTLVLKPNDDNDKNREHPFKKLLRSASILLHDLIVNEDHVVRERASESLYALLSTSEGIKILDGENFPKKISDCLAVFRAQKVAGMNLKIDPEAFRANVDVPYLWISIDHEKWIAGLVKGILKALTDSSGLMASFARLIDVYWPFAESVFPLLVDLLLKVKINDNSIYKETISAYVNKIFQDNFTGETSQTSNPKSVQCLLNLVDYVRVQRNCEGIYESDLNVNYLDVAKAAFYCSAYFTSVLYAELWFQEKKREEDPELDIDRLCEKHPEDGAAVAKILRECYFKIGIPDGIHGCGYNHLLDQESEIQHYEHLKKWDLALLHHDIRLSQNPHLPEDGLLNSLRKSGMFYTSSTRFRSEKKNEREPRGFEYECATILGDWSLVDSRKDDRRFEKWQYFALKAFRDDDLTSFQIKLDKARECVLSELSACSMECSKNVYEPLAVLRSLKESEDFAAAAGKGTALDLELLQGKWRVQDEIKRPEFKFIETISNQRIAIVKAELEKNKSPDVRNRLNSILCDLYFKMIKISRRAKRYDLALRNLRCLSGLEDVPEKIAAKINLERARIAWEKGEKDVGKFFLFNYLKGNESRGDSKAKGLRLYGDWMASTRSENARQIIENYYLRAVDEARETKNKVDTYASLAKFADYNYEQLHEYLTSPLFEMKQDLIAKQQDLASGLEGHQADEDKRRAAYLAKKQSAIDESEIRNAKREREEFLNLALKFYLLVLKEGEKYDLSIFRVVALWLSNSNDDDVTRKLKETLGSIPTYKFLCVLPQILPRMAEIDIIPDLVKRIASDHPYHALPLLFALEKSYEDLVYVQKDPKEKPSNPRVILARKILAQFQRSDEKNFKITIAEMNRFCTAIIELAHYVSPRIVSKSSLSDPVQIPPNLKISNLTKMDSVMVPTLNVPYRKNLNYEDVVKIRSFGKFYENVGGVTAPKKVDCLGTDGLTRALLIKGKDDLRQDAVMQQVFTIMNSLLSQNSESGKLIIRTYKVVPLSQRSGIIEWCDNTQPIGLYLIGKDSMSGAHRKFNPEDINASECRMRMRNLAERKATNREKLQVYLDICKKFRPAFHNYFIENFPTAEVWFERRLAYTLSVAASSMIGYILGIGDRHVCNILVDNATAEVIHIDLGIAFDQGKSLPTPEAVPFRLSRDVVDGMGLSGVEGVFRSACIKTMQVLRNNRDTILTLLEVLLYDPLYAWTITPEKAMSKQSDSTVSVGSGIPEKSSPDVEVNKMAERALIRLKQKLQGSEGGVPTNVEGQVNFLIQQARDPNNLSRMFHGWQAYL